MKLIKVERLDSAGYRKFGLIMAAFITIFFGFLIPWLFFDRLPQWPETFVGAPFIVVYVFVAWSLLLPSTLVIAYVPWMHFGHIIGAINTRIIMALIFYVLFTPMGIVMKLIGKDPLHKKFSSSTESYWIQGNPRNKEHMERNY